MTKFTANIPVVSYYEVEIEAENEAEARIAVAKMTPMDIEDNNGEYAGWDIDFKNLVINEITHQHSTVESIITCEKEPCATLLAPETA